MYSYPTYVPALPCKISTLYKSVGLYINTTAAAMYSI